MSDLDSYVGLAADVATRVEGEMQEVVDCDHQIAVFL
jgi:hypothetical protein